MNKRKPALLCAFLLCLMGMSSCSDDEAEASDEAVGINEIRYAEAAYTLEQGLLNFIISNDNYHNTDIVLTDGSLNVTSINLGGFLAAQWYPENYGISLDFSLYAPPGETLPPGRYAFGGLREDDVRDDPAKAGGRYHAASFITLDTNGNKDWDDPDTDIAVTGGYVEVAGAYPDYTLTFDLLLEDGNRVQGSYQGEYLLDE